MHTIFVWKSDVYFFFYKCLLVLFDKLSIGMIGYPRYLSPGGQEPALCAKLYKSWKHDLPEDNDSAASLRLNPAVRGWFLVVKFVDLSKFDTELRNFYCEIREFQQVS